MAELSAASDLETKQDDLLKGMGTTEEKTKAETPRQGRAVFCRPPSTTTRSRRFSPRLTWGEDCAVAVAVVAGASMSRRSVYAATNSY